MTEAEGKSYIGNYYLHRNVFFTGEHGGDRGQDLSLEGEGGKKPWRLTENANGLRRN
jgi:hypothetical protein